QTEHSAGLAARARHLTENTAVIVSLPGSGEAVADADPTLSRQCAAADQAHATGAPLTGIPVRAARWVATMAEYERSCREHRRRPRETAPPTPGLSAAERRLGRWARYQRHHAHALSRYQQARLTISTGFVWNGYDQQWHDAAANWR